MDSTIYLLVESNKTSELILVFESCKLSVYTVCFVLNVLILLYFTV